MFSKTSLIVGLLLSLAICEQNLTNPIAEVDNIKTQSNPLVIDSSNIRQEDSQNLKKGGTQARKKIRQDPCLWTKCGEGFNCQMGQCIPIPCKKDDDCNRNNFCQGGKCVPERCLKKCAKGFQCKRRKCVPIKCKKDDDCADNQICQSQKCVADQCIWKKCGKGFECKRGKCIAVVQVCTDQVYNLHYCPQNRTQLEECPISSYFPPGPPPAYCGITASGQRFNFRQWCDVCHNGAVLYYFDKPCYHAPFICQKEETCQGYFCSAKCYQDSQCPYDWQICNQGKCKDKCMIMKCPAPCKFGICSYNENYSGCQYPQGTLYGGGYCSSPQLSCFGTSCANQCVRHRCPPQQKCLRGNCSPQQ